MSRRMNYRAASDRDRIRRYGAETVDGHAFGAHQTPNAEQVPKPRPRGRTLDEPVIVDRFWANRSHDAFVVTISTFKGHNLIDLRKHAMNAAGQLVPTPKGVALKITRLPELAKAIDKALRKARELGLLAGDEAQATDDEAEA
jgi:Transcriptional Coactivator p15 (PC4)